MKLISISLYCFWFQFLFPGQDTRGSTVNWKKLVDFVHTQKGGKGVIWAAAIRFFSYVRCEKVNPCSAFPLKTQLSLTPYLLRWPRYHLLDTIYITLMFAEPCKRSVRSGHLWSRAAHTRVTVTSPVSGLATCPRAGRTWHTLFQVCTFLNALSSFIWKNITFSNPEDTLR